MPSKSKKASKGASKHSYFDQSVSPPSSSPLTPLPELEVTEEDLMFSLEEATNKYPSLIGTSAFVGRVMDVDSDSKGCKIWLSESSMVASSLSPGCTVSVSLSSLRKKFPNDFPLCSLADECAKHYGIACTDKMVAYAGNYFALATVFPSRKAANNGVRLSSNLSCTLGCPVAGRIVFVHPTQSQSTVNGNDKLNGSSMKYLSISNCTELYLELVLSVRGLAKNGTMFGRDSNVQRDNGSIENEKFSSPMTPSCSQSKLGSFVTGQLSSPRYEESISSSSNLYETSFKPFNISEVLGDESAKKLLQSCTSSWLCSRSLVYGNFVSVPILSKMCIFRVFGAQGTSLSSINQELTYKSNLDLFSDASDMTHHVDDAFVVTHKTKVHLFAPLDFALDNPHIRGLSHLELETEETNADVAKDSLKLGGLGKEYAALNSIIVSSVKNTVSRLDLRPTKGVLLHGPPGTGKTSLAKRCARDTGVNLFIVNGHKIVGEYGESEKALHEVFDSSSQATPAVVFIDDLDAIASARKNGMVATLLNLMDGICRTNGLVVIAATNKPNSIDRALRRPGRFDIEIEIGVPSPKQRYDILHAHLSEMKHTLSEVQIQHLSAVTHGFVGADLAVLCNEAVFVCLGRQSCDDSDSNRTSIVCDGGCHATTEGSHCSKDTLDSASITCLPLLPNIQNPVGIRVNRACAAAEHSLKATFEDFEKAKMKVRPSSMREVILNIPKIKWEDVGGHKEVKTQLMEAVEWPQKHHDAFKRIGTRPPNGVLLFGPPGCSKTLLARAVASEAGLNFFAVKGPEIFNKWVGESEKAVRSLFLKARENAPSIIFLDEVESLAVIRGKESDGVSVADRVVSQLLVELDGLQRRSDVSVIAATNRPDKIDSALLRPGRLDRVIYVGPPNAIEREEIFRIHLQRMSWSPDFCITELANLTEGCTGADIALICRLAGFETIEESFESPNMRMEHLKRVINQVQPSEIQPCDEELKVKFQRLVHSTAKTDGLTDPPCSRKAKRKPFWRGLKSIVVSEKHVHTGNHLHVPFCAV